MSDMKRILCIGPKNEQYCRIFAEHGLEVSFLSSTDEDEIAEAARGCEAILFTATRFTESLFSKLPDLKIISRSGIGIDTVDIPAATAHGVIVCNSASYGTYDVAEHTAALLLSLVHSIPRFDSAIKRDHDWSGRGVPMAHRLSEKTIGIVGFGRISRHLCRMMAGFSMRILVSDPYATPEAAAEMGVSLVPLDTLLAEADILSLNAPLTDETRHMINAETIARMKDGALLINTSRGGLIDEEALVAALTSGKLAGAALDVFENEPFAADHPLRTMENVVLTPHVAWRSAEAIRDLTLEVTGNVIDYFEGRPLKNALNGKALGL